MGSGRLVGRRRAENVFAQVVTRHCALTFFVQPASKGAIKALLLAHGFAQVANRGPSAGGVVRLIAGREGCQVCAKSVHAGKITIW